jgi:hypothetical protein
MAYRERALSDIVGIMLISFLIVVLALLIAASLTGVLNDMLWKPALFTVTASQYDDSGNHLIRLYHQQGDLVNLNDSSQTLGDTEIALTITDPSGSTSLVRRSPDPLVAAAWGPGQYLYIFPDGSTGYVYSDELPSGAVPLFVSKGEYTVKIIDAGPDILLHTLPVTITF